MKTVYVTNLTEAQVTFEYGNTLHELEPNQESYVLECESSNKVEDETLAKLVEEEVISITDEEPGT